MKYKCRIYTIFAGMNDVATYLTNYGMRNCTELVEIDNKFGRIKELFDIDIE